MPREVRNNEIPSLDVEILTYTDPGKNKPSPPIRRETKRARPKFYLENEFSAKGDPDPHDHRQKWLATRLLEMRSTSGSNEIPYAFRARDDAGDPTLFWLDRGAAHFLKKRRFAAVVTDDEGYVVGLRLLDRFFGIYGDARTITSQLPFDLSSIEDERIRSSAAPPARPYQQEFKSRLYGLYGGCAVTGTDIEEALDAAHIVNDFGPESCVPENGIMLRADIHRLYDRRLVDFQYDGNGIIIRLADVLRGRGYDNLDGRPMARLPSDRSLWPAPQALEWHRSRQASDAG